MLHLPKPRWRWWFVEFLALPPLAVWLSILNSPRHATFEDFDRACSCTTRVQIEAVLGPPHRILTREPKDEDDVYELLKPAFDPVNLTGEVGKRTEIIVYVGEPYGWLGPDNLYSVSCYGDGAVADFGHLVTYRASARARLARRIRTLLDW